MLQVVVLYNHKEGTRALRKKGKNTMKDPKTTKKNLALLTEEELDALLDDAYFLDALEEMAAEWEAMEMYEKGLATW